MLATRQKKRTPLRYFIIPVFAILSGLYFTFHAFEGDFGILSREKLEAKAVLLQTQLAEVSADREKLEWRVRLLQDGSIERDMLDERARLNLGLTGEREVVIVR